MNSKSLVINIKYRVSPKNAQLSSSDRKGVDYYRALRNSSSRSPVRGDRIEGIIEWAGTEVRSKI